MATLCANCQKQTGEDAGQVCRHALAAANSGEDLGFFFGSSTGMAKPDAWCRDCETLLLCDGFSEQWFEDAGFVVVCASCWESAKAGLRGKASNAA
jgi:hypothetical protein